ncbi:MAG: phage tail spike protein, partial [Lachnospiraceae bacterium]|nr:phage tail spike protein [Lachnospiraceae bacterium]
MENVRIAILNTYDNACAFLDNTSPGGLHYYNDELHEYLKGTANTYSFKCNARHEDSVHLSEGNKLAFRYRNRDYYLNIMRVTRDENEVEVEAYSLNFELLNEQKEAYKAASAMTFKQYLDVFDYEKVVTLGINEVSGKSITHEWTGTETMLARIFSLANVFGAEIEFIPELNPDHSLKRIIMNVYKEHTDSIQGVGRNRTDLVLRYGKDVSGITKTSDITELYTAIRPIGRNGLTVSSINKTEYDLQGKVEYTCPAGKRNIYAVQARDRFPSNLMANENERYIAQIWEYDTDNVNVLYGQALAQLKKNCVPQVSYEVEGYFDTDIGDTVTISDQEYTPELYLQARVTEQQRSFTDPSQNKTTFSNFKELQSQIDPALVRKMNEMISANKVYTCSILTDNGIVFRNGEGATTLTASVMDVGKDMTDSLSIQWYTDEEKLKTGKSITVKATDFTGKSVYKYEATDKNGKSRGYAEVTIANINDGEPGKQGEPGKDGGPGEDAYTLYLTTTSHVFNADCDGNLSKNISVSTVVVGYKGSKQLTPVIGKIPAVSGLGYSISGTTITITAVKGSTLADNGTVDIPVTLDGIECTLTFTYAKVKDGYHGENARLCTITGNQIMKYESGSVAPDPETLVLNATYQNANHQKWQYLDQYDVWVDFSPSETGTQINITENSAAWLGNTAVVRALDKAETAIDVITLAKLRDGRDGQDGKQGIPGQKGADGKTSYTHIAYANSADGAKDFSVSDSSREYVGMYVDFTAADSTDYTKYAWSKIKGADGSQGIQGPKGADGKTPYLHIAYANSADGKNGFSTTDSTNKMYLGQYTDYTSSDSTDATKYSWTKIKGETGERGLQGLQGLKGDQGIQGPKGADGKTSYTHIAYANSVDGKTDFTVSDSNRAYVGMYVDFTPTDSTDPTKYAWSKIKGADGSQGIQGPKGADGKTPYLHIAYANSADGKTGFSVSDSINKLYIGQYTDYASADSTDYTKYAWTRIKGETGSQGIQGPKGADGKTYYTWLKYADTPTTGMSDDPTGKKYIGLAYNKTTQTESTNYGDYAWSLIKGDKGDTGVPGGKGADGKTYYTWVKYATSASGANMSDSPSGKTYIGLAYNKTTATESTNAADYAWSLIKGDKGDTGAAGTGYTLVLSNESHIFAAGVSAAIAGNTSTNVTAFKNTTQVAATVTKIGSTTVSGNMTGVATGYTGLTADVSGNGTTSCKITFKTTTALVTKNGSVAITITVDGKAFTKYFSFSLSLKGADGGKGDKGDPTGIIESATAPTTKYTGMLWKHTGTVSGLIKNATYRWDGSAWKLFIFRAENIEAESFKGYEFNGSVFKSDFEEKTGKQQDGLYHWYQGNSRLSMGQLEFNYSESVSSDNVVWNLKYLHDDIISAQGIQFLTYNEIGNIVDSLTITPEGIFSKYLGNKNNLIYMVDKLNQNLQFKKYSEWGNLDPSGLNSNTRRFSNAVSSIMELVFVLYIGG